MKILLVGIDFFDYTSSLQQGLESLGHTVKTCEIKQNWGIFGKIYKEIYNIYQARIRHSNPIYGIPSFLQEIRSKRIVSIAKEFEPDLLIAFPGYGLSKKALKKMGEFHKTIWIYDSINRLPRMLPVLSEYHTIFTFEGSDLTRYKELGYEANFLPLCVDNSIYYPIKIEQNIDILFIGNLSESRVKTLLDIRDAFPTVNMLVYGRYSKTLEHNNDLKDRLKKHQDIFTKKLVSADEANILYSRSKICINLHHGQSQYGANMRLFEICAAGGFQIVDSNPYIEENYQRCMVITHNSEEMKSQIEYYLPREMERKAIATNGYERIKRSELFMHRAKVIVDNS